MAHTIIGRLAGIVLTAAVLSACGGGGGGGVDPSDPDASSATGWWAMEERDAGTSDPFELSLISGMEDDGATTWFMGCGLTRTDTGIQGFVPNATDPARFEFAVTFAGPDRLEGQTTWYSEGAVESTSDVQLTRTTAPTGSLEVSGTIGTQAIDRSSSTAYADDLTACWLLDGYWIYDVRPRQFTLLAVNIPDPWSPGIYDVADGGVGLALLVGWHGTVGQGATGTLEITRATPSSLAGTFDVTFEEGGSAVGSFDGEVLLVSCD